MFVQTGCHKAVNAVAKLKASVCICAARLSVCFPDANPDSRHVKFQDLLHQVAVITFVGPVILCLWVVNPGPRALSRLWVSMDLTQ